MHPSTGDISVSHCIPTLLALLSLPTLSTPTPQPAPKRRRLAPTLPPTLSMGRRKRVPGPWSPRSRRRWSPAWSSASPAWCCACPGIFMWVNNFRQKGLRGFWSMCPLTRAAHFGTGFLSHCHLGVASLPSPISRGSCPGTAPSLRGVCQSPKRSWHFHVGQKSGNPKMG